MKCWGVAKTFTFVETWLFDDNFTQILKLCFCREMKIWSHESLIIMYFCWQTSTFLADKNRWLKKSLKNSEWKNKQLCLYIVIEILPELPSFPFGVGVSVVGLCLDYWSVGVCWVAVTGVCGGHAIGCDGYCDQCNRFHPRVLYPVPNHGAKTPLGHPIFGQHAGYSGVAVIDSQ